MVDPCGYFHLVVLLALWGAIFLFYCQYRECLTSQKKQKILIEENDDLGLQCEGIVGRLKTGCGPGP